MARGPTKRVVLNRQAIDEVILAVADGALEVGRQIIEAANPPDATPYGEGLTRRGGWIGYVGSRKIGGGGLDGKQPKKPRAVRVPTAGGITIIAGFGFPGRFQEFGTIHHGAQPFLTPAMNAVLPRVTQIMADVAGPKLKAMK